MLRTTTLILGCSMLFMACSNLKDSGSQELTEQIPEKLPMHVLPLHSMEAFKAVASNWNIAAEVYADYQDERHLESMEGEGVLVNLPTESEKENLFFLLEHEDLELEVEFLMPKGSNSGIYFQGRYEVQLLDSWGKTDLRIADCGAIYQRWDPSRGEGNEGFEGNPPKVNASKAPGLWQKFHILFRAPRFNEAGEKLENAKFEYVYHNGMLVQENVEISGPTRAAAFEDEVAMGPLMIQGDHGPVAFRNIRYKAFNKDTLELSSLDYKVFPCEGCNGMPSLDTLTASNSGQSTTFNVAEVSGLKNHYAMTFDGTFEVKKAGKYLFETQMDDDGDLFIDDQLVVKNTEEWADRAIVDLDEGTHKLKLSFFQNTWRAHAAIFYEGPDIEKRTLASIDLSKQGRKPEPILIDPNNKPEMVRGFVNYGDEKKTHTIAVGDPQGLHYIYDLPTATLLKCWKGEFADVTNMWKNRGQSQLLIPLNAAIELSNHQVVSGELVPEGYELTASGHPVFKYRLGEVQIKDMIRPSENGVSLERTIEVSSSLPTAYVIAEASDIRLQPNGLHAIDGAYYISTNEDAPMEIIAEGDQQKLVANLNSESGETSINYTILW